MFAVGTQQKKRPDNLVLGRLFSDHILDLFEFCVSSYEPLSSFKATEVNSQLKPILVF